MQMPGFILHGWLCYYNDGEVVKKNIDFSPLKSINSCENVIRIAYGTKGNRNRQAFTGFPCRTVLAAVGFARTETPMVDHYEQLISKIRRRTK
jgi:hypothetical protein